MKIEVLERLKKISVPSILGGGVKTSLSVYISNEVLRILELNKERKPTFKPIEEIWEGKSQEEKKSILKKYVELLNLKGRQVNTCILAKHGILKTQRFPGILSKKNLEEAVKTFIEVEKRNIKEESIYDYYVIETPDKKYKIVVLVIVRKSAYDFIEKTFEEVGLKPKIVDYEITALINGGLIFGLHPPFSILYVDYHESIFVYYTGSNITYNILNFTLKDYLENKDETLLDEFALEVRNLLTVNEVNAIYLAGKIIEENTVLDYVMTNLPVLNLLEPEGLKASFFIPYILSVRGLEGK